MASALDGVQPGDVLVVRTKSPWGRWIRLGAWLSGKPSTVDHVAVVHHRDDAGIWWAIEGRPGGVGWVDIARYDSPFVVSNAEQPKTDEQRKLVCDLADDLLKRPYDWSAIAVDAFESLRVGALWASKDYGDEAPGQVVCSSLAAWVYKRAGLAGPAKRIRWVVPADWAIHCQSKAWLRG